MIIELRHRVLKRAVDRFDAVAQQILETNDERETEPALARFVDHLEMSIDPAVFLKRPRNDVARFVDGEITAAPTIDIVSRDGGFNVPLVFHFFGRRHGQSRIFNHDAANMQAFATKFAYARCAASAPATACFSRRLAYRFAAMNKTVIEVQVRAVLPTSGGCAVFLGNNDKVFIIYVDQTVGSAITMFMREVTKERPLTHDLMGHLMTALGAQVERVIINDLKNATYYARMIIRAENELQQKKIIELDGAAERLHRHGDATKSADLRQPGSLGRSRRHERRPAQDGRGRSQARSRIRRARSRERTGKSDLLW